eukprot:3840301-Prymnesium_polylepis.1
MAHGHGAWALGLGAPDPSVRLPHSAVYPVPVPVVNSCRFATADTQISISRNRVIRSDQRARGLARERPHTRR